MTSIRLLTRRQVEQACGLSRSSIYRKMREGTFPEPIKIGARAVRWPAHELEEWLAQLPRATGDRHAGLDARPGCTRHRGAAGAKAREA